MFDDDGVLDKIYWLLGKVICVHGIRSVTTVYVKVKGKVPEIRVLQRIECKKCGKVWYEERARYSSDEYDLNKVERALQDGMIMEMP